MQRSSGTVSGDDRELRADIQALRALAVSVVVIYHLWPGRLPGGYVGVDCFFVISGYLITGHLAGELDRTGRVRLGAFWARRARRLVPASSVVLLATTVGVVVLVPLALWRQFLGEVVAAALQLENWRLAHDAVDYLASDDARSPVQHFWSLATEEQFYLGVPLLLLTIGLLTRRRPSSRVPTVLVVLAAVTLVSFTWSVRETVTDPGVAYFSTLTRAWEFGVGALLACWPRPARTVGSRAHRTSRLAHRTVALNLGPVLGVAAVVLACLTFDDASAFPGYLAAVPVLGAAVALATGAGTLLDRLGRTPPVALLGRVSYAVYLWHLPLIVLVPFATGHPLGWRDKLAILVATAVLSVASTFLLEEPIRFRTALLGGRRPLVVGLSCGVAVALVVAVSGAGLDVGTHRTDRLAAAAARVVLQHPHCLGAQAMDPRLAPCDDPALDGVLVPDPATADGDDDNLPECWEMTDGAPDVCHLGTLTGYSKKLLALGDSHNNTLVGDYRSIGEHQGWRIDVAGEPACYVTDAPSAQRSADKAAQCRSWKSQVIELARDGGYDAIIVTHASHVLRVIPHPDQTLEGATVTGLVGAWDQLPDVPIVAIRDNPVPRRDVITCVSQHPTDAATACGRARGASLSYPDGQRLAAKQVPRARFIDLTSFYCDRTICPAVIGHVLVYRDDSHITATYAHTLEPYLESRIVAALAP